MPPRTTIYRDAIERLAERLHWKFEHLDPTGEPLWSDRDDGVREIYRIAIRSLLVERDSVLIALVDSFADNDVMYGRIGDGREEAEAHEPE